MTEQTPGHLFGPPAPHIAFYYGDIYLGETRGHPANVRAAEWRLMEQTSMLFPGPDASARRAMIANATGIRLFCGDINVDLRREPYRPSVRTQLEQSGYWTTRDRDEGLTYVLLVVHDPVRDLVVGLLKQKGPEFLLGKITFPGGRLEDGESPEEGASREMREETGLDIPVSNWKFVCRHADMMVLAACSANVVKAVQREEEPVFAMSVPRQLEYAKKNVRAYSHDFIVTLTAALSALTGAQNQV